MTSGWSEDRVHRWLARGAAPRGLVGSRAHDAAVTRRLRGLPVTCTDACVEGVHFTSSASPRAVGRKAVARVLSDLAATAARPRALLVALSAPRATDERWIRAVLTGARSLAREHGADLVGGDLCASEGPRALSVTALGEFVLATKPPGRARARAGDVVLVTGPLGGSLLGRHLRIEPRVQAGEWLARRGARALMDVSDGLAWDVFRLARTAGVAIQLELARVPIHADARRRARVTGRTALEHALHDGEDHELVATVPRAALARILREAARVCPRLRVIGRVHAGRGLTMIGAEMIGADGDATRFAARDGGFRHGDG